MDTWGIGVGIIAPKNMYLAANRLRQGNRDLKNDKQRKELDKPKSQLGESDAYGFPERAVNDSSEHVG